MSAYLFFKINDVMSNKTAHSLENIEGQTLNQGRSCVRVEKLGQCLFYFIEPEVARYTVVLEAP